MLTRVEKADKKSRRSPRCCDIEEPRILQHNHDHIEDIPITKITVPNKDIHDCIYHFFVLGRSTTEIFVQDIEQDTHIAFYDHFSFRDSTYEIDYFECIRHGRIRHIEFILFPY